MHQPQLRTAVLRHDVDKRPHCALKMAQLEHQMGIRGTYYFRCVKASWDEPVMRQIAIMGHEIGYHYEDLTLVNGDHGQAIRHFEQQLSRLREIYPVKTICMHGSPLSKHDNRDLWKHYNYRDYGIIGEPYFDVDFSRVLYLTDTGRRWDGDRFSIRDRVSTAPLGHPPVRAGLVPALAALPPPVRDGLVPAPPFKSTHQIITSANNGALPNQILFTFHPQRWTSKPLPWLIELVWQNAKNVVKAYRVRKTVGG